MNEKGEPNEEAGWASRAEEIEGPKTRGGNSLKSSKENDWFTEGERIVGLGTWALFRG